MRRITTFVSLLLFFSFVFAIPNYLNYQGKVTTASGAAPADGSYIMTFRICNTPAVGGVQWSETQPAVLVFKGLLDVRLGNVTPINLPFDEQYYLEIEFAGETMSPRIPLSSVGYAYRSAIADSAVNAGSGGVTEINEGIGVLLIPDPITTTGLISFDQTWGDARYSLTSHTHNLTLNGDVTGTGVVGGTITTDIAADAVGTAEIIDGAVTLPKINTTGASDDDVMKIVSGTLQWAPDASGSGGDDWGVQTAATNAPITGNGTAGSPIDISYSDGLTLSGGALEVDPGTGITVDAGGVNVTYGTVGGTACEGDDARLHASGSDNQNLFDRIQSNGGASTCTVTTQTDIIRFNNGTNTTVNVSQTGNRVDVSYDATGGGSDNDWAFESGSAITDPIYHTGLVGIGGNTSASYRLNITGDGRATGNLIASGGHLNFGTTSGSTGYGIRSNAGTIEYRHNGDPDWTPIPDMPTIPGGTEYWIRPTATNYIRPVSNDNIRIYDSGEIYGFYYEGNTNIWGGYFYTTAGPGPSAALWGQSAYLGDSTDAYLGYVGEIVLGVNDTIPGAGIYSYVNCEDRSAIIATTGDDANVAALAGYSGCWMGGWFKTISASPGVSALASIAETDANSNGILGICTVTGATPAYACGIRGDAFIAEPANSGDFYGGYFSSSDTSDGTSGTGYGVLATTDHYGDGVGYGGYFVAYGNDNNDNNVYGVRGYGSGYGGTTVGGAFRAWADVGGIGVGVLGYAHDGDDNIGGEFQTGTAWGQVACEGTNVFGAYFDDGDTLYSYVGYNWSGTGYKILGSGTASTIMKTREGQKILFCPESPEIWFEDLGSAKLIDGHCHVELDPIFLDCVTIDENHPMKVFVQLNDDCNGVYVKKGKSGFDVYELAGGTSAAEFDYRIMAKRRGDEDKRFPEAPPRLKPTQMPENTAHKDEKGTDTTINPGNLHKTANKRQSKIRN